MKPNANTPRVKPDVYRTLCIVLSIAWGGVIILSGNLSAYPILDNVNTGLFCLIPIIILAIVIIRLQDLRKAAEQTSMVSRPLMQTDDDANDADDALVSNEMVALLQQLNLHFDESELRALCFDLHIEPENLPGQTRQDRVREIIKHMLRRGRIRELYAQCELLRPGEQWRHPSTRA